MDISRYSFHSQDHNECNSIYEPSNDEVSLSEGELISSGEPSYSLSSSIDFPFVSGTYTKKVGKHNKTRGKNKKKIVRYEGK